ncbi:nuclear transport factor 2 family protein [Roseobacter sp. HKCCA0434]|uniref:nuclear transport factor 2 family protein n=1 Tax=Roseobacter sp. HKCCA0434 TaxID=3079297 RepID=UPI002905E1BA|nr:nuclear transport factor 2 family protein [Roseobacter sp. HKCCA0434]
MQDMKDRAEIENLVARFDDAVNRRDQAAFRTLWTADGRWQIMEPHPLDISGRDEIVATWQQMVDATKWLFRGSFAGVLDIDADTATGRWPCIETGTMQDGTGYDNRAIYEDSYVREGGVWLFRSRTYHYLWLSDARIPGDAMPYGTALP